MASDGFGLFHLLPKEPTARLCLRCMSGCWWSCSGGGQVLECPGQVGTWGRGSISDESCWNYVPAKVWVGRDLTAHPLCHGQRHLSPHQFLKAPSSLTLKASSLII